MCCSMSSALVPDGDQAEGGGLANTAVLFPQLNPRLRQDACLFTCIQGRSLLA